VCPYTLHNETPLPSKLPLSVPFNVFTNTWFPGSTRVSNPNGMLIISAVFAGLTSVTDRPTDRPRDSVGNSAASTWAYLLRSGLIINAR